MEAIRKSRWDNNGRGGKVEIVITIKDTTERDVELLRRVGLNVDLSDRVKVIVDRLERDLGEAYTFLPRQLFERLGVGYIVAHARIVKNSVVDTGFVEISQNDWYNDPARNPERIVPVKFVEIEQGTGREVYRGIENGRYYLREVFYPRESCAKWYVCGKRRRFEDGDPVRANTVFEYNGERERVRYDDWNGVMAYSDTFNRRFHTSVP